MQNDETIIVENPAASCPPERVTGVSGFATNSPRDLEARSNLGLLGTGYSARISYNVPSAIRLLTMADRAEYALAGRSLLTKIPKGSSFMACEP